MANPYYKQHWIDIEPERHAAYDQILGYHPGLEPIIRPLELTQGLRVLDVGSGPAHTTIELARRVAPSGTVTGVDINAEFIARAGARAREAKLPVEFTHSGFPPLPFPTASFDRVFCKNCGTRLFGWRRNGTVAGVALAAFDDRNAFAPTEHIWVAEKMHWVRLNDGLPQHPGAAPA